VALGGEGCKISLSLLAGGRPIALLIATESELTTLEEVSGGALIYAGRFIFIYQKQTE